MSVTSKSPTNGFKDVISDEMSLHLFIRKMREFDHSFVDQMMKGSDFTLRLEVRGNKGELLHVRCYMDDIERPDGAQKRVDEKKFGESM